jgi:hypothetical protein
MGLHKKIVTIYGGPAFVGRQVEIRRYNIDRAYGTLNFNRTGRIYPSLHTFTHTHTHYSLPITHYSLPITSIRHSNTVPLSYFPKKISYIIQYGKIL